MASRNLKQVVASPRPPAAPRLKDGKGKGNKTGGGKGPRSDAVLEVYLCGGRTPADVILLEVWDEGLRARVQSIARVGDTVRVSKVLVVAHNEKTRWFTTSKHPMYLKAVRETAVEQAEAVADHLEHHPVTPIASVSRLPPRMLICTAGRVMETPEVAYADIPDGETDVPVAHLALRANDDVFRISFWRDTTTLLEHVAAGSLVFVQCVATQGIRSDLAAGTYAGLRATPRTSVTTCPPSLAAKLQAAPMGPGGARHWSPASVAEKKDYASASASWMSLSVLHALCAGKQIRNIDEVFQVPSVLLEFGSVLTYPGCSRCKKAWRDEAAPPCGCGATRVQHWRAKVGMRDATGQLQATCFEALAAVVGAYRAISGDTARTRPEDFASEEMASTLAAYVGAIPFTARLTVAGDGWTESMQATVQLLEPTFQPRGLLHPLKAVVRTGPGTGACPPLRLAATSFDEGVGMTPAHGCVLDSFRGLLTYMDVPNDDASATPKRQVRCACSAEEEASTCMAELASDHAAAVLFRNALRGSLAHAVLAWRAVDCLSVIAFQPVHPDNGEAFSKFFTAETAMQSEAGPPPLHLRAEDTPVRIVKTATALNVPPPPPQWKVRKTM